MPNCIELLPCDWLISNLCYQAIEQVYLIKWPMSVYIYIYIYIYICIYTQFAVGLAQGVPGKSLLPTSTGIHLVLHPILQQSSTSFWYFSLFLSWASYILSSLPGHCQLQQDQLFCGLRVQDDVRSQFGLSDVRWNFQLPFQVNCHCPVPGCGEQTYRAVFWCFLWLLSYPDEGNGLGCSLGVSAVLDPLADCLSDGFEDLVVPPSIPALTQQLLRMCSNVPTLEQRGHAGVSILPHLHRLDGLERSS